MALGFWARAAATAANTLGVGPSAFKSLLTPKLLGTEALYIKNILSTASNAKIYGGGDYYKIAAERLVRNLLSGLLPIEARLLILRADQMLRAGEIATKYRASDWAALLSPQNPYVGQGLVFDSQGNPIIGTPTWVPGVGAIQTPGSPIDRSLITQYEVVAELHNPVDNSVHRFVSTIIAPHPMSFESLEDAAQKQLGQDMAFGDTPGLITEPDLGITVSIVGIQGVLMNTSGTYDDPTPATSEIWHP
tara:strand:+ start:413 stop:1156 length:744 start_codon:yes stop_codon:yes gene_type:complete